MGEVKELNIKNRTYYYFNDIIDIKDFQSNLLKSLIKTLIFTILVKLRLKILVIVKIFIA